jgi:N-acetylneuraminate synthase
MHIFPKSVYIIAEAGVNHNGNENIAKSLIDIAADAKADAVKFQFFYPPDLVTSNAYCADYQSRNLKNENISQLEMLKNLTLENAAYIRLSEYCTKKGIDFLCTPFDQRSLDYLAKNTAMPYLKLASGEVTHGPLLLSAARTGLPIILSTGMSNLDEIGVALSILYFGYNYAEGAPTDINKLTPFMLAYLREKVTLMHCVSQYPAPISATNLLAMDTLVEAFSLKVGLSDHSEGFSMSVAASARGACIIEKHFTYDIHATGPDHAASLSGSDLKLMIQSIREVSEGMGDGKKICRPEELNTREVARRSVVAATPIKKGDIFSEHNLICKRPSSGPVAPNVLWQLLGKAAKHDYAADTFIDSQELLLDKNIENYQ